MLSKKINKAAWLLFFIVGYVSSSESKAQNSYVDSMLNWLNAHPKIDSLYIQTLHRISYRLSEKDVKKSFAYYEQVASLSDSLNYTYGKSLAQINLGILLYNSGNFEASNNAYFKAIELADSANAKRLKAVSLNNIGENFKILKDYEKCRKYAAEAIEINKSLNAMRGIAINYELLHECAFQEKLYHESQNYLLKGMPYADKANESYVFSQYYLGFGKIKAIQNSMDSANFYFSKALKAAIEQNDLRNEYQVYLAEAKYSKSLSADRKIVILDSALKISKNTSYLEGLTNAAHELSSVYDAKNNRDSSLYFYRIYRAAADSLFDESNKRNVVIKEAAWMVNRKEIENKDLKALAKLQSEKISIRNILLVVSVISFLFIIVIIYFVNRSIQFKKKREEAAFKQKVAETQMLALKAQINPHFIFNNLNSIENFLLKNDKHAAGEYFTKMGSLVNMIVDSSDKECIPISKEKSAIETYVSLQQLRHQNKFSFSTSFEKKLMSEDYHVPPLLLQPYVENAIANSIVPSDRKDLELSIKAKLENNFIVYTITDNGVSRKKLNGSSHQQAFENGIEIAEERISIINQRRSANTEVATTDLYDNYGKPDGTKVEIKIKIVEEAIV